MYKFTRGAKSQKYYPVAEIECHAYDFPAITSDFIIFRSAPDDSIDAIGLGPKYLKVGNKIKSTDAKLNPYSNP